MVFVEVIAAAMVKVDQIAAGRVFFAAHASRGQLGADCILRQLEFLAFLTGGGFFHFLGDVLDLLRAVLPDFPTFSLFLPRVWGGTTLDVNFLGPSPLC